MPKTVRVVLILALVAVAVVVSAVGVAVAAIYQSGSVDFDLAQADGGTQVAVNVPAGLVELAIALVPAGALPASAVAPVVEEMEPYWPLVESALNELAGLPDFILVEVDGAAEHLLVRKEGKRLIVLVESDEERIRVAIPLETARKFWRKMERMLDRI